MWKSIRLYQIASTNAKHNTVVIAVVLNDRGINEQQDCVLHKKSDKNDQLEIVSIQKKMGLDEFNAQG